MRNCFICEKPIPAERGDCGFCSEACVQKDMQDLEQAEAEYLANRPPPPPHWYEDQFGHINGLLQSDGFFYLEHLYVYPQYRRQGHGKRLMALLPRKVTLMALPAFESDAMDEETLVAFYKKLGFALLRPDTPGCFTMVREV